MKTKAPIRVFVSDSAVFGDSINNVPSKPAVLFLNDREFVSAVPVSAEDTRKTNDLISMLKEELTHA